MKRIVILGAGFGGLHAAQIIGKYIRTQRLGNRYEVVIVERNDHHTYTPMLYEVATTSKEVADITRLHGIVAYSVEALLQGLPVHALRSDVAAITITPRNLELGNGRELPYDYLIIAPGSEVNYFDIPGVEENAVALKTFQGAIKIRDMIWDMALSGTMDIRVAVGGAGSTGVEFAGELQGLCRELDMQFPKCRLGVALIEAGPDMLPGFQPRIVDAVKQRLLKLGARIMTGKKIVSASDKEITIDHGERIPYSLFVWAGGVKAPEFLSSLRVKKEHRGLIAVDGMLRARTENGEPIENIFAVGDAAYVVKPDGSMVPQVARAAILEGAVAAKNICELIRHERYPGSELRLHAFHPADYPYVIPVGGKYAIAKYGPFTFSGIWGWIFKGLVELNYLFSIMPIRRAFVIWLKGLRIFLQNDRLG